MLEIWKPVIGYEDSYEVSSLGQVRSIDRIVGCNTGKRLAPSVLLKPSPHARTGHLRIALSRKRKMSYFFVHTLMMRAFVGERPNGYHICHNDGNPQNNVLSNLRYDTAKANNFDKIIHGTIANGERNGWSKLTKNQVLEIRRRKEEGESLKSLAASFNTTFSNIANIWHRRTWNHI